MNKEAIIEEIKKNKRERFDAQGNRLYRIKDLRKILNSLPENEDGCPDCGERYIWICACDGELVYPRKPKENEIAKRKIEEFVEERKPTHPAFIAGIASILHWLDSREEK